MGAHFFILFLALFGLFSCARTPMQKQQGVREERMARPRNKPLPLVVLDPGHGGESHGTETVTIPRIQEKTLALQCSLKVAKFLEDWGYQVRMTRKKDEAITLPKRVQIAQGGAFFVSIHFNHAPNPAAHGVEIFYYNSVKDPVREASSKVLAKDILRYIVRETDCYSRGVHAGNFHVIRENSIPAVLVEGGFCSNLAEAKKLTDPHYITKLAYGIARGIDLYADRST